MEVRLIGTPIDGVLVVEHEAFEDDRGFFVEITGFKSISKPVVKNPGNDSFG